MNGSTKNTSAKRIRRRGSIETLPSGAKRVRVRGVGLDGRPYDLKDTFPTQELAERAKQSFLRRAYDLEAGIADAWSRETLAAFVARERATRRLVWRKNDNFAWSLLAPLHGRRFIEIDSSRVLTWARSLADDGYSFGSANVAWVVLARAVKLALSTQAIPRAPWGEVPPPWRELFDAKAPRPRDALTPEQWQTLWTAARDLTADGDGGALRDLDLRVLCLRNGALRPVEVCRLRHADLDVERGTIWLREVAKKRKSEGAHVPIGRDLAALLAVHVAAMPAAARATGWLFPMLGAASRKDLGKLKWVGRERPKYLAFVTKAERDALRVLGVTWDLYSVRHTAATEAAVEHGMKAAAEVLRHEGTRVIGGYVHARPEHYAPMVEALDERMRRDAQASERAPRRLEENASLAERIERAEDATELQEQPAPTGGDLVAERGRAVDSGSSHAPATGLHVRPGAVELRTPKAHKPACNCRRCQVDRANERHRLSHRKT
jgi:integrase